MAGSPLIVLSAQASVVGPAPPDLGEWCRPPLDAPHPKRKSKWKERGSCGEISV
jgi:hypothetical protein